MIPEEELPGWVAAIAISAVVVAYAWWMAVKRTLTFGVPHLKALRSERP